MDQSQADAISSSLEALSQKYELITYNLANSSTPAFKRRRAQFEATLQQASARGGAGQIKSQSSFDFAQGTFAETGRPLDFAIDGKGFFEVESPQGVLYTRYGSFTVNAQGQLTDAAGRLVTGERGPITIPKTVDATTLRVSAKGEIQANGVTIGKLKIDSFANPNQLTAVGPTLFKAPTSASPIPADKYEVRQGYQEQSNVNLVEELVGLVTVSKMYEANLKTVNSTDDRLKTLLNVAAS